MAKVIDEAAHTPGVAFGKPKIDLDAVRAGKDKVVGKLTGGLVALARQRKVQVVRGAAKFTAAHTLRVEGPDGPTDIAVRARHRRHRLDAGAHPRPAGRPARHGLDRRAGAGRHPGQAAGDRRRLHRPRDGHRVPGAGQRGQRGRVHGHAAAGRRCGPGQAAGQKAGRGVRRHSPEDQSHRHRGQKRRPACELRRPGRQGRQDLRPRPGGRRPAPERQGSGPGGAGRHGDRARLHRGRRPAAHRRGAHLRHRRCGRRADAGAQGRPRGQGGGGSHRRSQGGVRAAGDPGGGVHRPGDRLGRPDRTAGQKGRHRLREGGVPVGGQRPQPDAGPRRGPDQDPVRPDQPAGCWASASSARAPAT